MKDFVKIFLALCFLVITFLFGRRYGEDNFKQTEEFQSLLKTRDEQNYTKNDFENAKTKFQNVIDGAETKKSDELLGQILQIFLADLGLRIQDQKTFIKSTPIVSGETIKTKISPDRQTKEASVEPHARAERKERLVDYKRLKSYEWILQNSANNQDLRKNLANVEIKNMDQFLRGAVEAKPQELENIFGSYRGRIMDINNKEYGTLAMEINPVPDSQPMKLKGSLKIFKNGKETTSKGFMTTQLGYRVEGTAGIIIDNGNTYFQIYKTTESQQIAGIYYERLVNGTTNIIGSFVLNRVDQF